MNDRLEKIELLNLLVGGKDFKGCMETRGLYGSYRTDWEAVDLEALILTNDFFENSPVPEKDRRLVKKHFLDLLREM